MKTLQVALVSLLLACLTLDANALTSGQITISNGSGPYFYSDDGNCGVRDLPRTAYLAVNVLNTSTVDTLWVVKVKLTSISNANFKLLNHLTDSIITISRILPLQKEGAFFFLQYPCQKDINVNFTFNLSDRNGGSVSYNPAMSTKDMGPAGAGGTILYQNVEALDALGVLLSDTVIYEFGNYKGGEMVFQPSGDTLFPADKLELLGCEVLQSDFNGCGLTVGTRNTFYFNSGSGCGGGSGNTVKVVYYFINSMLNEQALFKPYAAMKSGAPIKYSPNYGDNGFVIDSFATTILANKFILTSRASCNNCSPGGTITYTIKIENISPQDLMIDRIINILPNEHLFLGYASGSDIGVLNTSIGPEVGDSSMIFFEGRVPSTFPYRSYVVPGDDSIFLKFTASLPTSSSNALYVNDAITQIGELWVDTTSITTCVGCDALPVTLLYFEGIIQNEDVLLKWATASEINNRGFSLYRQIRENTYQPIGFVDGKGYSSSIENYEYLDLNANKLNKGALKYQLVQEDYNRDFEVYNTVVMLRTNDNIHSVDVYPNPFEIQLNVEINESFINPIVIIKDMTGLIVFYKNIENHDTNNSLIINTDYLPSTMYIVEVWDRDVLMDRSKLLKL